jgi:hypothetical protein
MPNILGDGRAIDYWTRIFDKSYKGDIDSWTYLWAFTCWIQSGLAILPETKLVPNIGFGTDAMNTEQNNDLENLPTTAIHFPLQQPSCVIQHAETDEFTQRNHYESSNLGCFVKSKVKS